MDLSTIFHSVASALGIDDHQLARLVEGLALVIKLELFGVRRWLKPTRKGDEDKVNKRNRPYL